MTSFDVGHQLLFLRRHIVAHVALVLACFVQRNVVVHLRLTLQNNITRWTLHLLGLGSIVEVGWMHQLLIVGLVNSHHMEGQLGFTT